MDVSAVRIDAAGEGARLAVRVRPGARRDRILGILGERLKLEVKAPPERGRANQAACALVAHALGLGLDRVEVASGHGSRDKVLRIAELGPEEVRRRLASGSRAIDLPS